MDRRQQKTRAAIFAAFTTLLSKKSYSKITVQEIIDMANIGRTTFYAHFETKDDLLKALCEDLFNHIITSATDCTHTYGLYSKETPPASMFCHLLQHLQKNENNIIGLLSCENNEIFLRYFKNSLNTLVETHLLMEKTTINSKLPQDFLINHICTSFVEMVLWWIKGHQQHTPEELDRYFQIIIEPIL